MVIGSDCIDKSSQEEWCTVTIRLLKNLKLMIVFKKKTKYM